MANEVALTMTEYLTDKIDSVGAALPRDINKNRFITNCITVLNEKPELARINKAELVQGLLKGAYLGLDFAMKECYLIPYGNSVQFQTDYKGEIKFTKRYSIRPIRDIYAKVVRADDEFTEKIVNGQPSIDFTPKSFSKSEIIGAFAVVNYTDGGMDYEVMSTEEINAVRKNYSKVSNSGAWVKSWDEMAKKTVLRRLCKHIETDFESVEAMKAWEEASDFDADKRPEIGDIVSNPFAKAEEKEKQTIIEEDGSVTEE